MKKIALTSDQARSLENFVEDHITYCMQELDGTDPEESPEEFPENWGSYGPFCGCLTCESREYLMATFDWMRRNKIADIYVEDKNVE